MAGESAGPDGIEDVLHGASALMPVFEGFMQDDACKQGVQAAGGGVGFTLQLRGVAQVELEGALEKGLEGGGVMKGELLFEVVLDAMVVEAGGRQGRDGGGRTDADAACRGDRGGNEVESEGAEERVAIRVQFGPGVMGHASCSGLGELKDEFLLLLPFRGKRDGDALGSEAESESPGEDGVCCGPAREDALVQAANEHDGQFPLAGLEGIEQMDGIPAAARTAEGSRLERRYEFGMELAQGEGFGSEEAGRFPCAIEEALECGAAR